MYKLPYSASFKVIITHIRLDVNGVMVNKKRFRRTINHVVSKNNKPKQNVSIILACVFTQ